jgi:transposase
MQRLKRELSKGKYAQLEWLMWILRKKHEFLNETDQLKLKNLYKYSPKLKQAHSFAPKLTHVFNTHGSRKSSIAKINRWISKVEKSDITCFNSFIVTLEKYKAGIVNYFKNRKNSGFVEGLNNKIKVAKRRCYGFFKVGSLFQRLFLDLCGDMMLLELPTRKGEEPILYIALNQASRYVTGSSITVDGGISLGGKS